MPQLKVHVFFLSFLLTTSPALSWPSSKVSHAASDLRQPNKLEPYWNGADTTIVQASPLPSASVANSAVLASPSFLSPPSLPTTSLADSNPTPQAPPSPSQIFPLDLDPTLFDASPVLQRWLKKIPDIQQGIRHDPSFRTRLRLGYSQFPSTHQAGGLNVGLEDLFIGRTSLTVNGDYQTAFNGDRAAWGSDLRYYLLPLGGYINIAPVLGYRHLHTTRYSTDGLNAGLRLLIVPSRTGAADISLTQSWVSPSTDAEVGLTTLSFGYALTHHLRLSTDIQKQNARQRKDSRVGIVLEWMF